MTTTPETKQPWRPSKIQIAFAATAVGGIVIGALVGGAGKEPEPAAAPEPRVVTEEIVKEVEVQVESTPEACVRALDVADGNFIIASDAMYLLSDSIDATLAGDYALSNSLLEQVGAKSDELDVIGYQSASAECRAAR